MFENGQTAFYVQFFSSLNGQAVKIHIVPCWEEQETLTLPLYLSIKYLPFYSDSVKKQAMKKLTFLVLFVSSHLSETCNVRYTRYFFY